MKHRGFHFQWRRVPITIVGYRWMTNRACKLICYRCDAIASCEQPREHGGAPNLKQRIRLKCKPFTIASRYQAELLYSSIPRRCATVLIQASLSERHPRGSLFSVNDSFFRGQRKVAQAGRLTTSSAKNTPGVPRSHHEQLKLVVSGDSSVFCTGDERVVWGSGRCHARSVPGAFCVRQYDPHRNRGL